jgi:hypothetical protein
MFFDNDVALVSSRKMQEGFMFMHVIISCPLPRSTRGMKKYMLI